MSEYKTHEQFLIDKVNRENNLTLQVKDFIFGEPIPILDSKTPAINTKVSMSAQPWSPYRGSVDVYYERLDVQKIFSESLIEIIPSGQTKLSELIPIFNERFGLSLEDRDYYDTEIPPTDPDVPLKPRYVSIVIKPDSLLYTGTFSYYLGSKQQALVDEDKIQRTYYVFVKGQPLAKARETFYCLNVDGSPNKNFTFLGNVKNIGLFNPDTVVRVSGNQFVFDGDFVIEYQGSDGILKPVSCKSLRVDGFGMVLSHNGERTFGQLPGLDYQYTKDAIYVLEDGAVHKYTSNGVSDTTFNPLMIFAVQLIRATSDNKLYVVSKPFKALDPYNPSVTTDLVRIDRLMSDGSKDPLFNSVFFRPLVNTETLSPITDLCVIDNGGFYVFYRARTGVDIAANLPVINNVPMLPPTNVTNTTFGWNPVFRFYDDGIQDPLFKSFITDQLDLSIYDSENNPIAETSKVLVTKDNTLTLFTYRRNPITMFKHPQPVQFKDTGEMLYLSGLGYKQQVKWTNYKSVTMQKNNEFMAFGQAQTLSLSGGFSAPEEVVVRYTREGSVERVLLRLNDTGISISDVFINEVYVE